jgi:hypothetical protein
MDWKEFLKPDWRKIIVFILSLNFLLIPYTCHVAKGGCDDFYLIAGWLFILISISFIPQIIIPLIIFDYFLSCFIIWIYDKYKKKRIR